MVQAWVLLELNQMSHLHPNLNFFNGSISSLKDFMASWNKHGSLEQTHLLLQLDVKNIVQGFLVDF